MRPRPSPCAWPRGTSSSSISSPSCSSAGSSRRGTSTEAAGKHHERFGAVASLTPLDPSATVWRVCTEKHNVTTRLADSVLSARGHARQCPLRPGDRPPRTLGGGARPGPFLPRVVRGLPPRAPRRDVRRRALPVDRRGRLQGGHHRAGGSALGGDVARRHRRRLHHPCLLRRLHARRSGLCPLFYLSQSLRLLHGHARALGQLPPPLRS